MKIQAIKSAMLSVISPKKAEKMATNVIKDSESLSKGLEAKAAEGRAMVRPYEAPEMKEVKLNRTKTMASSGENDNPGGWGDYYNNYGLGL